MRRAKRKNSKKIVAIVAIVLILAILATAGTIAWLTRTSQITNTFTVGSFTSPTTDPTDPTQTISISGNLYEPSWHDEEEHKLIPGNTYAKDPYVGIGPESEDAVVYVNVENNIPNNAYFTINTGWEAVTGQVTAGPVADTYKSGIFKYTAGLTGSDSADVWTTTPLFSEITTAENANASDFTPATGDPTITVKAFLHQAKDSNGDPIDAATIEAAAITAFTGN